MLISVYNRRRFKFLNLVSNPVVITTTLKYVKTAFLLFNPIYHFFLIWFFFPCASYFSFPFLENSNGRVDFDLEQGPIVGNVTKVEVAFTGHLHRNFIIDITSPSQLDRGKI